MTVEEAKQLKHGDVLLNTADNNRRWRVNGKVKTWVTRPNEVRVPVKHGLYAYDYVTQDNVAQMVKES